MKMSMSEVFDKMTDHISEGVPHSPAEYMKDGLLHCSVCHKKTQTVVEFLGIKKTVRCICDCRKAELEADKERERQEERLRQRRVCFAETNMMDWTFENDDRRNEKLSDAMIRYCDNFDEFRRRGMGLLLHGSVGTGKTYYAACIANRLIDNDYHVYMTNFSELINKLQGTFDGKQEIIDGLNKYTLLIIDDLGIERNTEYMKEMVYNIIDSRYRSGLPFIVTTNLTMEKIKKPEDISDTRIYDRVLERCHPVAVEGISRRRQNVKESFHDMQAKLGL